MQTAHDLELRKKVEAEFEEIRKCIDCKHKCQGSDRCKRYNKPMQEAIANCKLGYQKDNPAIFKEKK